MPVTVTYSPEDRHIIIAYSGRTTPEDLVHATQQAARSATSHDCYRILVDARESEPAVLPVDLYEMPKWYDALGIPSTALIAMVRPETAEGYGDFHFYETVCKNRGFTVETFEDMASAKAWLAGRNRKS